MIQYEAMIGHQRGMGLFTLLYLKGIIVYEIQF